MKTTGDRVYQAIIDLSQKGVPPTWEELRADIGLASRSSVDYWLWKLRDAGRVTWEDGRKRTLRVVEPLTAAKKEA